MRMYNNIDVAEHGVTRGVLVAMGITGNMVWSESELAMMASLEPSVLSVLLSNAELVGVLEDLRTLILSKVAIHGELEGRFFAIPQGMGSLHLNGLLLGIGMSLLAGDTRWRGMLKGLRVDIAKGLFSKDFKEKYSRRVMGFSGVALTHGGSVDEVYVPAWTGLRVGELVAVFRHPVQNIFLVARVGGLTTNEFRINPSSWKLVDGDFDGDEMGVVPLYSFGKKVIEEGKELFPSSLLKSQKFSLLMEQYK